MIRRGKYSAFEGSVCGKEKHDAPSISWYFLASEINVFFLCKHKPTDRSGSQLARHGKFIKCQYSSFTRRTEIIRAGKYSIKKITRYRVFFGT